MEGTPVFRELQTFVAVCQVGTFTGAAARRGMTQSAVSDHIRRLEDFVGAPLFRRNGRSALLNQAGARLLPMAEEAIAQLDRMRTEAAPGPLQGRLRVGTVSSLHNTLVARAMIAFRQDHPDVSIRLIRHDVLMLAQVEREELDLAVTVYTEGPLPITISLRPLLRLPFVLVVPATLPDMPWRKAACALPLLRYDQTSPSGQEVDAFLRRERVAVEESLWINYSDTILHLVSQGMGVAFIHKTALGLLAPHIRVMDLGAATFYRKIGILRRATPPHSGVLADRFSAAVALEAEKEIYALPPETSG
jgi:DNA-binding transcriptional LysR family regulator